MRIDTSSAKKLLWASPPPVRRPNDRQPSPTTEDSVELSLQQAHDASPFKDKKLLKLVGLGLMATGRLAGMVTGGPNPLPVVCAQESAVQESRLQQVLTCALVDSPSELASGQDRANFAWEGLRAEMGGMSDLRERPGDGKATAWPYGQVMAAALNRAKLTGDYSDFEQLVKGLEKYEHPDGGYSASTGRFGFHGNRFMDDNAWLGLVFVQAAQQQPDSDYLQKAEEIAGFLDRSRNPDGGLIWEENNANPSYNTATFGPSIELSLRLFKLTGDQKHLKFAREMTDIMEAKLRRPDGLYHDNLDLKTGKIEPTLWSYNQGTPVGAHLLWYDINGDPSHLTKARQTASAAMEHFGDDGLWKQPPAFNAVFLRNLMQLNDPAVEQSINSYLERAWSNALNPETGLFNKPGHGMGSYEGHGNVSTLDQAALTQLYALRSWPVADRGLIS